MSVYRLRAMERFADMEAADMPFSVWLPYTMLNSERFVCEETGEIWERFRDVTLYVENEEYPEGDLIDETEEAAYGVICWQKKNGACPEAGDVFRVVDGNRQIVFEETISGESYLFGRKYMTAEQKAPMACERLFEMEQGIKDGLDGQFITAYFWHDRLKESSSADLQGQMLLPLQVRGLGFQVVLNEFETEQSCDLKVYSHGNGELACDEFTLMHGEKWYEVRYFSDAEPGKTRFIGCGLGSAREAMPLIVKCLEPLHDKMPLNDVLTKAGEYSKRFGGEVYKISREFE